MQKQVFFDTFQFSFKAGRIKTYTQFNYPTFGSPLIGRTYQAETSVKYRYSFNGKETDAESDLQDYGMRIYNSRLCRFLSIDPLTKVYPWYSPYQFAGNSPIRNLDLDGKEELDYLSYSQGMIDGGAKLLNSPFPNDIGGGHWVFTIDRENAFFTTDGYCWNLKPGVTPAASIQEILDHPENYSMDCGTYVQVTKFAGMLKSMGADKFNDYIGADDKGNYDFQIRNQQSTGIQFSNLYMGSSNGKVIDNAGKTLKAGKVIKKSAIGTEITLTTPALKNTPFYNENIVKVGEDQYLAQGLGDKPMTMDEIKTELIKLTKNDSSEVYVSQIRTSSANIINKPKKK